MPEERRLDYPLGHDSLVLDAGCYRGDFAYAIAKRFGCNIYAFEPIPEFFAVLTPAIPKLLLFNYGLGARTETVPMWVQADGSSRYWDNGHAAPQIKARIRDVVTVFEELDIGNVDLLKLNIEGGEYTVLDRMIETGLINRLRYLQVQFHTFGSTGSPAEHRDRIREGLYKTHREHWISHPWRPEDGWRWASWSSWVRK